MTKWSERLADALLARSPSASGAPEPEPGHSGGRPSRGALVGVLVLALVVALFWAVSLLGKGPGKSLDAFEFFYPDYAWLYGELAAGQLPLWNPYQLCGIPTLGTLQSGLLYPPHLLHVLLPTHLAMAVSGLAHLVLIGATTLLFGLRAGLSPAGAWLAAALVAMRGAQPGHLFNSSMQESGAWLAVGGLGVLDLLEHRPLRGTALLALATGMSLLAGFPQYSVYTVYACGFLLVTLLALRRAPPRSAVLALAALLGAVALGALLAAVQLLPGLELAEVGGRERGVMPLNLMLPFGAIGFETVGEALGSALGSRPALPAVAFTFGFVGLLLAPFALAASALRAHFIAVALLGALTLGFALGPATPLFDLYLALPELGSFRNPWRILFVTDFSFAIVAGIGLDGLLRLLGGAAPLRKRAAPARRSIIAAVALGILVLALGELFLARGNPKLLPYDRDSELLAPLHEERAVLGELADGESRVFTLFVGDMGDVPEKLASLFRIRSISDYEIMTLQRQREYFTYLFWGELEPSAVNRKGHSQKIFYGSYNLLAPGVDPVAVAARNRLVELAAARHLLVPRSGIATPGVSRYLRETGLRPVDIRDRQIVVFENARALPRAYVTHRIEPAPEPRALLARLSSADYDPRRLSYLELGSAPAPALALPERSERVAIIRDGLHEVALEVELDAPGVVVLADSYYPGWHASVDGEPATIHPANHLFRGVAVPAGSHELVFRYQPTSVRLGAALSLVGAILLFGLFAAARRVGFRSAEPAGR